jgi:copper transport protein
MLLGRCVWLLAAVGIALGVTATAAQAHATLLASVPAAGQRIERGPAAVTLTFDEPVAAGPGALRVLDAAGRNVARGGPFRPGGDASAVAVHTDGLARGSYVVAWQVVSDDGHVVNGAYAFGVGVPAGDVPAAVVKEQIPAAPAIRAVLHGLLLASIAIALGLLAATLLVARTGTTIPQTMLEFAAWTVILFVAFFDIFVQADTSGLTMGAVVATRYGISRLVMMVATIVGLVGFTSSQRRVAFLLAAGAAIAIAEAVSGHAGTGPYPLATSVAALAHLLGASIWIGLLLATARWPDRVDVERVSSVAAWCVFAIAASAVPQVLAGVASIDALVTTAYGLLVCAKFALLLLALAFALVSRRRIAAGARAVVPTVRLELLVLTAVLAVTAVLVESPQPHELASAATPARIAEASFTAGDVAVTVTTSATGERARTIDIRLTRAGTPANADAVTATIGETRTGTGPLTIPVRATAPGTYRADTTLPFAGTWHAHISVRNGPFDEGHTTLDL